MSIKKTIFIFPLKYTSRKKGISHETHVLLNLLNEMRKIYKMRCLSSVSSLFHNKYNKFNNTGARMLDSIYHMALK